MRIPQKGRAVDDLLSLLDAYQKDDLPHGAGRTFSYVYRAGREVDRVAERAFLKYLWKNALDPTVYPSLLRLENEIVAMAAAHLHGDSAVCGNFTSGGTESCTLAVKTARDAARAKRPDLAQPQIVLPVTAHGCFQKAAHYLGVKVVPVPVDPRTCKADVAAAREAITDDTILVVGSAPSYAHGVVDPIEELASAAADRGVPMHVDGCIGGFLLPYFERLGEPVPPFDFRVPGVTSMSMDLHKYAYVPKGASVVLYRSKEYRKHQLFTCARWTGYTLVNTTIQSSKGGGPLAAAWAVLGYLGDEGYLEIARSLRDAMRRLVGGIERIDGLRLMARPDMVLMAVECDGLSVFHLADRMAEKGWYIQPQLAFAGLRENFHVQVNPSTVDWIDPFLADLEACVAQAKTMPFGELGAQVRDTFATLDPNDLTEEVFQQMLGIAGIGGTTLPDKMADINEMLDALPRPLTERILTEFVNELFRQPEDAAAGGAR